MFCHPIFPDETQGSIPGFVFLYSFQLGDSGLFPKGLTSYEIRETGIKKYWRNGCRILCGEQGITPFGGDPL